MDVDSEVVIPGIIIVVIVVMFTIARNATNALCELSEIFFCWGVLVLVLVERRVGVDVVDISLGVIVLGEYVAVAVVVFVVFSIAWNVAGILYELSDVFFSGILVL